MSDETRRDVNMIIFISHSSNDSELAKLLVNLLQKALRLSSADIRAAVLMATGCQLGHRLMKDCEAKSTTPS